MKLIFSQYTIFKIHMCNNSADADYCMREIGIPPNKRTNKNKYASLFNLKKL